MLYDPTIPPVRQPNDWSCSCCATTWALQSLGHNVTREGITAKMVSEGLVSPALGLLDGSGADLANWLGEEFGLLTQRRYPAQPEWVMSVAGAGPVLIGGAALYHWVAVRYPDGDGLALSNPAPGWHGIGDYLDPMEWARWGQWAAIWIPVEEAPVTDTERAYVQEVAANEIKANIEKALTFTMDAEARDALQYGALPASNTLAEGRF